MKTIIHLNKFILLLMATFLSNFLFAQTKYLNKEWQKQEGILEQINAYVDEYVTPQSTTDNFGNVYVVSHERNNNGNADILTVKYDCDGNTVWKKLFDNQGLSNYGTQLTIDNSGNVLVCGATNIGGLNFDYVVVKYDAFGNELWHQNYNGTANDIDVPVAITTDNSGNVYVTGASNGGVSQIDYCTIKYNGNGIFQWEQRYDFANNFDIPAGVVVGSNGNVFVTGGSGVTFNNWDFATLQLGSNGVLHSVNRITNPVGIDRPTSIKRDNSGNIYIAGSTFNSSNNSYDEMVVKYSPTIALQWVRKHDADGKDDGANSIDFDLWGNVYLGGYVKRTGEGRNFSLLKYDAAGNLIWQVERDEKTFSGDDEIKRIKVGGTGNVAVIGDITKSSNREAFIMLFDKDGNKLWEKEVTDYSSINDEKAADIGINNFGEVSTIIKEKNGNDFKTTTAKHTELKVENEIVYDANTGEALYFANQIVVKFNPGIINTDIVNNREITFSRLPAWIPQNVVQEMSGRIGVDMNYAIAAKVFTRMTVADSVSLSRIGEEIKMPPFGATLLVFVPRTPLLVSNDMNVIADSLKNLSDNIYNAHPNILYRQDAAPNDILYPQMASLRPTQNFPNANINVEDAWDVQVGQNYVKVGVYDDPILWSHEDFGDGTFAGSKIAGGWNFVNNQSAANTTDPLSSHGTAVAGIIGALRNNNIGVAGIAGGDVANGNTGVQLFSMGIFNGNDSYVGDAVASNAIIEGAEFNPNTGYGYGYHIQNHSWGGGLFSGTMKDAVIAAGKNGCVLIASRGNNDNNDLHFPACLRDRFIINVGASGIDGEYKDDLAASGADVWFGSSFGGDMDFIAPGTISVVAAPQYNQKPFDWNDQNGQNQCPLNSTGQYSCFNGTSAAAPHVSGVAALLYSQHNINNGYANNLTTEDIEELLQRSATDVVNQQLGYGVGYDDNNGWGLINATAALNLISWPQNRVFHSGTPGNTSTIASTNQTIVLAENINGVPAGTYFAQRYQVTHTYLNVFSPSTTINGVWERSIDAHGLSAANPVVNYPFCSITPVIQGNVAAITMNTFCWKITSNILGQQMNAWVPDEPQNLKTAYSLLLYDPQATSIKDVNDLVGVNVYPNPTEKTLNIRVEGFSKVLDVELTDILGRKVYAGKYDAKNGNKFSIDVSNIASGTYVCKLNDGINSVTKKFIKN